MEHDHRREDHLTLARTLFGEAEAGDEADAIAIAWVVRNRAALPNWPDSIKQVCLQPWQFSCWNHNDPNRARISQAMPGQAGPWFDRCHEIARQVLGGEIPDPTRRATHYYASWMKAPPRWSRGKVPVYETPRGRYNHFFFNDIDTPPPASPRDALDQQRPLASTGTMKGAAAGLVAGTPVAVDQIAQIQDTVATVSQVGWSVSSVLQLGLPVLAIIAVAAIGWMAWRRYQDRKAGLR